MIAPGGGGVDADAEALAARRRTEVEYWRTTEVGGPEDLHVLLSKMWAAGVLVDCLERYRPLLAGRRRVLELGGGQGWGACLYKRLFPGAEVTTTDISPHGVAEAPRWERLLGVRLAGARACTSDAIDAADGSLDVVFCFGSAHHFVRHRRTFAELRRVLAPGGVALYLYEPTCSRLLHPLARRRVNWKRPHVPEDVLVGSKILALAREAGLEARLDLYPSTLRRGPVETVYYLALERLPLLKRILPCTANLIFTRPGP